jgi:hypothetical protein
VVYPTTQTKLSLEERHNQNFQELQEEVERMLRPQIIEVDDFQRQTDLAFEMNRTREEQQDYSHLFGGGYEQRYTSIASEEEVKEFVSMSRTASNNSSISIKTRKGYELRMTKLEEENKVMVSKLEDVQKQNEEIKEQNKELKSELVSIRELLQGIVNLNINKTKEKKTEEKEEFEAKQEQPPKSPSPTSPK